MPTVPMFPLNTVLFPGSGMPLHVFEDRYRALLRDVLAQPEPPDRVFGIVAIREGYEVGDHGVQSAYRIGTLAQVSAHRRNPDGTFDIEVLGRDRIRLEEMHVGAEYFTGEVTLIDEDLDMGGPDLDAATATSAMAAREVYTAYLTQVAALRGIEVIEVAPMPTDPEYLSYAIAAQCVLPLPERQELLEAPSALERLDLVRRQMREELRAMAALPSLPATELARTRWSPN